MSAHSIKLKTSIFFNFQIWYIRFGMLVKLKQFSMVEVEAEAFGDLDKPDLYHEFYSVTSGDPASQSSGLATNAILFLMLTKLIIT